MIRSREQLKAMVKVAEPERQDDPIIKTSSVSPAGTSAKVKAFVVKTVGTNTLTCREVDPTTMVEGSTSVTVLKPQDLQRDTSHGKTINGISYSVTSATSRLATAGTYTENQVIVPAYVPASGVWPGSMIWAVQLAIPGFAYSWMDLNVDARAWCWDGQ